MIEEEDVEAPRVSSASLSWRPPSNAKWPSAEPSEEEVALNLTALGPISFPAEPAPQGRPWFFERRGDTWGMARAEAVCMNIAAHRGGHTLTLGTRTQRCETTKV
jgi:hypothetical protein